MKRTTASLWTAGSSILGLFVGMGIGRLASEHTGGNKANIIFGASVAGAAAGAGIGSYVTTPKVQQLTA